MIEITDRWVVPLLVYLADWSVRWGLVLAALALWLSLRPPRLAGTRHTLCLVGLAAGILLPVVPRWGSVPIAWPAPIRSIEVAGATDSKVLPVAPRSEPVASNPPERPLVKRSGTMSGPASPVKPAIAEPSFADRIKAAGAWRIGASIIAGSWMLMVTMNAARMIGGRRLLAKLREEAAAVDSASQELLADCRTALGLARRLNLAMHPGVASPVTLGGFRPLVLVPPRWDRWPQPHRRACLLHELAHLARRDDAAKLVGELVRVPLFFNPLVLWLLGRLDYERELLCARPW
jgi:BlaR1 peptidase M56